MFLRLRSLMPFWICYYYHQEILQIKDASAAIIQHSPNNSISVHQD